MLYQKLVERQNALLAHPEQNYKVQKELREVDEALAKLSSYGSTRRQCNYNPYIDVNETSAALADRFCIHGYRGADYGILLAAIHQLVDRAWSAGFFCGMKNAK